MINWLQQSVWPSVQQTGQQAGLWVGQVTNGFFKPMGQLVGHIVQPVQQGWQGLQNSWQSGLQSVMGNAWPQSITQGVSAAGWPGVVQTGKTMLPYAPLMAAPHLFYNTLPNTVSHYQQNMSNRDFTQQYFSALTNPSVSNVGRMHQGYFNYADQFGHSPYIVTQPFLGQSGVKAGWTALTHSPSQLAQAKVVMPQQTSFNHQYPTTFMA